MLRIRDTFEEVLVPDRLRAILYSAPLRIYARNCWHGGLYRGEKRAPILQTQGTDVFSECLAYTVMHLVMRTADSNIREFDTLFDATAERQAIRLGATYAAHLTEALLRGIRADREGIGFDTNDRNFERTIESFHIVSQVMYPGITETRGALINYDHQDPALIWIRAIDHAIFLPTERLSLPTDAELRSLTRLLDATIESFYPFFLAKMFGETMYEHFETARQNERGN